MTHQLKSPSHIGSVQMHQDRILEAQNASPTRMARGSGIPTPRPSSNSSASSRSVHVGRRPPSVSQNQRSSTASARGQSRDRGSAGVSTRDSLYLSRPKPLPPLPTLEKDLGVMALPNRSADQALSRTRSQSVRPRTEQEFLNLPQADLVKTVVQLRTENKLLAQPKPLTKSTSPSQRASSGKVSIEGSDFQKIDISGISQELEEVKAKLSQAEKECAEQKTRAIEAEKRARRTIKELALAARVEPNIFDDAHFEDEVKKLRFDVFNWARNQDWRLADDRETFTACKRRYYFLKTTCPQYMDYVADIWSLADLIEAYIWRFFVRRIFRRNVWMQEEIPGEGGRVTNQYEDFKKYLEKRIGASEVLPRELLEDWRVASARVLAVQDKKKRQASITIARQRLLLALTEDLKEIAFTDLDLSTMEEIIEAVIKLDCIIEQQRPIYSFGPLWDRRLELETLKFKRSEMELTNSDGERPGPDQQVKLTIKPALHKLGTAAGKNYNVKILLLKAVVEVHTEEE
ncbi:uncharacterized protein PAC_18263 [Phialocephala subalpina]|uniref:Uncharacterized protein n=1 Tax=Phialocephala subalpina TaxID=576137 RepID=A0A1L7XTK1_9HELO|nr:uncharacterized protein PAC_18263 [Phialocephala subalpina]